MPYLIKGEISSIMNNRRKPEAPLDVCSYTERSLGRFRKLSVSPSLAYMLYHKC